MNRYVNPVDVLGPDVAKRVEPLGNGRRYVRPGAWTLFASWLVDSMVVGVGVLAGTAALVTAPTLDDGTVGVGVIALIFGVPLLYGVFYGNGRALGALLTGTRLVQLKDGGRPGFRGPWAMLVRVTLLPLLIIMFLVGSLNGGGTGSPPGSLRRGSMDVAPTYYLWAAEAAANS
ncbi:hypothetical protein [Kribbella sp. CA-293567]|uniref:hypothetical protein n=1 Tax=Kribbella sp. CA-293567 TaxID=3002436 RepID=UPI0022DE8EE7|nr:hypothetical protein [Kribbella sp. CA-293567]WBQ04751.1 hypothetical protein OX958_32930 [Kribbella sp. CA-293567]